MREYRRSLIGLIVFVIVQLTVIAVWFDLGRAPVHDETHFVLTIRQFADDPGLETLRTYNEMSTPLPFLLYAGWGKLFGPEPAALRTFSLLIALATYVLIHGLAFAVLRSGRRAFWLTVFVALNPYMAALSVLIYTDMLAIGFATWATLAMIRGRPMQLGVALAAALLCRQYALVYSVTFVVWLVMQRPPDARRLLIACIIALAPLAILCAWWGGLAPDNATRARYASYGISWQPASFTLYVVMLWVYPGPLLILRYRELFAHPGRWAWALVLSLWYLAFPIRASQSATNTDVTGFFDRLMQTAFGGSLLYDAVYMGTFFYGLFVLFWFIARVRDRRDGTAILLSLIVIAFLAIMPLSYLRWEKYFLLILPAACLAVLYSAPIAPRDEPEPTA